MTNQPVEPTPRTPTRLSFLLDLYRYFLLEWLDDERVEADRTMALDYAQHIEAETLRLYDPR